MPLATGTRLASYEILAPLGAGGMGEVYRARDARLGRAVAIKVLPDRLVNDPTALARFEHEARAVAALSHPNILALHDFGRDRGITFAVMELLHGEPLNRRLATEAFHWTKALELAAAVADGMAFAHSKGIVHRDLKPANLFLTSQGHIKILDFGLAKRDVFQIEPEAAGATVPETQPGMVLGTVGYMSPEQVRGDALDHRTDIFALGCVLHELLTGRATFRRDTPAETFAAILRDQPAAVEASGRRISPRVDAVVRRCLEKDPDQRFQSAHDLAFALRGILRESDRLGDRPAFLTDWISDHRPTLAALAIVVVLAIVYFAGLTPALLPQREPQIQSLAVLPLANLSGDRDQDYFADAMTEELTTRLAKLGAWRVTSRTSVMAYRGTTKKASDIARELGVDAVVQGSMIRDRRLVKITIQLIDGRTDRHLWADSYERELESVLAIQSEVAREIAQELELTLTPEGRAGLEAATRRVNAVAYDAYVRGRHAWEKRGESDLREAIRFFQQSLDADPTYAPAYAGIADCYGQLGYGSYVSPEDSFPLARAAAQKAIDLDGTLADAHASLGYALMYYDWNFAGAEAAFKRAIELNPNYAVTHQWYAYLLTALERPAQESEQEIAIARRLDPLSVAINTDQAYIFHYTGRNDEAIRAAQRALSMNPKFTLAYFWLGRIYTYQGQYSDAEAAFRNIGPLRKWTPAMAALGFMYGKAGRRTDAEALLAEFDDLSRQGRYASSYAVAVIHAGLGNRTEAFSFLDAAYRERSHWLLWLKHDPRWDDIRADPRFVNLVRKVGLP